VRELSGLSQRALAHAIGTSQPTLATLETGNRVPTIRTLLRVADATGFELVIGLRRTNTPAPNPNTLRAQGFDLLGTLKPNPQDGLADFVVLREPSPLEGPR
jgi:transcriptional regulator with XRE-family HTH domain